MPYSPCIMEETVRVVSVAEKMHLQIWHDRSGDGIESSTLSLDDLAAGLADIGFHFFIDQLGAQNFLILFRGTARYWVIGMLEILARDQGTKEVSPCSPNT